MSRARFDNVLATGVVACWLLMVTCYTLAEMHWFRGAMAGMAGAYAREIDPLSAPRVESNAWNTVRSASYDSRHFVWGGIGFAVLAVIGAVAAALRTYRDWRSWHWLTFLVFAPVTGAAWFAIGRLLYGTGRSSIWIPVTCDPSSPAPSISGVRVQQARTNRRLGRAGDRCRCRHRVRGRVAQLIDGCIEM